MYAVQLFDIVRLSKTTRLCDTLTSYARLRQPFTRSPFLPMPRLLPKFLYQSISTLLTAVLLAHLAPTPVNAKLSEEQEKIIFYLTQGQTSMDSQTRAKFWALTPPEESVMYGKDPVWQVRIIRAGQAFQHELWTSILLSRNAKMPTYSADYKTMRDAYLEEARRAPTKNVNPGMYADYENGFLNALEEIETHCKNLMAEAATGAKRGKLGEQDVDISGEFLEKAAMDIRNSIEVLDWLLEVKPYGPKQPALHH